MFRLKLCYFTNISQKYVVGSNNLLGAATFQWSAYYTFSSFCTDETT